MKGVDYVNHVRAIAHLAVELKQERGALAPPEAAAQAATDDETDLRYLLASRQKALNRSKCGGGKWFPEESKKIEGKLGTSKNQ